MDVAVVGGGIGGLSAAVGLTKRGHRVTVFERRPKIEEIGSAISLWANARTAASALGVRGAIDARSRPMPAYGKCFTERGREIKLFDMAPLDQRVAETSMIMRQDLVDVLAAALPSEVFRLGETVIGATEEGGVVTRSGTEMFDLVVGADGLNSVVRQSVWPEAAPPKYAGCTTWRFITKPLDSPPLFASIFWGEERTVGFVPLTRSRVYCWANRVGPAGGTGMDLSDFQTWPAPIPALLADLDPDPLMRHDLYFLPRLRTYVRGRVALFGDAAHAMTPDLGQGGCQSMEDAVVLAALAPDLRAYDKARRGRSQYVAAVARNMFRLAHRKSRALRSARDLVITLGPKRVSGRIIQSLTEWRPPAL